MDKKIKISELPEFDATRYLENEQDIAMYLTCVLEENDAALLAAALGDIAKARGMAEVARIDRSHAPAWECRVDAPASPGESVAASWTTEGNWGQELGTVPIFPPYFPKEYRVARCPRQGGVCRLAVTGRTGSPVPGGERICPAFR